MSIHRTAKTCKLHKLCEGFQAINRIQTERLPLIAYFCYRIEPVVGTSGQSTFVSGTLMTHEKAGETNRARKNPIREKSQIGSVHSGG